MKSPVKTSLVWAPRILCILYAAFISLFALDAFDPRRHLGENLLAFSMHLIPTAVILLVLAVSWRRAWVGGVFCVAFGVLYVGWAAGRFPISIYVLISGPLFLTGVLFLLSWIFSREPNGKRHTSG
jgi:hypothetical protein